MSQEGVGVLYVDKRREERGFILDALASDPRIRVDRVTLGGPATRPTSAACSTWTTALTTSSSSAT